MNSDVKISERERKCLEVLAEIYGDESDCYYMRYIAKSTGLEIVQVRRSVRSLARKGLAEYVRGLFDDEGMVAGSGYRATKAGAMLINPCKICGKHIAEFDDGECGFCWDEGKRVQQKSTIIIK